MRMAAMTMVVLGDVLLLGLLGLFSTLFNHLDVVVENGGNHWDHVGLNHTSTNSLSTTNSYVDYALKGEVPLPHVHHILASALLEDADETLDTSIDGENVSDSSR
jgi:hypothetical protein